MSIPQSTKQQRIEKLREEYRQLMGTPDSSPIAILPSTNTSTEYPTCDQSYEHFLDICQNIYQKFLFEVHENCPTLDIAKCVNCALQIGYVEVHKLERQGDQIYLLLFNLLQEILLAESQGLDNPPNWRTLVYDIKHQNLLQTVPYKIFFFFFRILALILYTMKDIVAREKKHKIAVELLQMIHSATKFLQNEFRRCPLQDIFGYCRKNTLSKNDTCSCRSTTKTSAHLPKQVAGPTNKTAIANNIPNPSEQSYQNPSEQSYQNPSAQSYQNPSAQSYPNPSEQSYQNPSAQSYPNPSAQSYPNPSDPVYNPSDSAIIWAQQEHDAMMQQNISQSMQSISQSIQAFAPQQNSMPLGEVVFSGNIQEINLWQILQMLGTEKITGCLHIDGSIPAVIYLAGGKVTHCDCCGQQGEFGFFNLVNIQEGRFSLLANVAPLAITMDHPMDQLLFQIIQILNPEPPQ